MKIKNSFNGVKIVRRKNKMNNMLTLHTEFTFDSAHHLEGYDGRCQNIHGHSWLVEVWIKGDRAYKDDVGILVDFGIVKTVRELFDHKDLNACMRVNPTAENLSEFIYNEFKARINNEEILVKVRVYESYIDKKCWCEFGDFE